MSDPSTPQLRNITLGTFRNFCFSFFLTVTLSSFSLQMEDYFPLNVYCTSFPVIFSYEKSNKSTVLKKMFLINHTYIQPSHYDTRMRPAMILNHRWIWYPYVLSCSVKSNSLQPHGLSVPSCRCSLTVPLIHGKGCARGHGQGLRPGQVYPLCIPIPNILFSRNEIQENSNTKTTDKDQRTGYPSVSNLPF